DDEQNACQGVVLMIQWSATSAVPQECYSRFCTCSRAFSISDFIPRPKSVMREPFPLTPPVFESSVFASRFQQGMKMLDVRMEPGYLFFHVATLRQHGRFLQHPIPVKHPVAVGQSQ